MSAVNYAPAYYGGYIFPPWAEVIGWALGMLPLLCVVLGAIWAVVKYKGVRNQYLFYLLHVYGHNTRMLELTIVILTFIFTS